MLCSPLSAQDYQSVMGLSHLQHLRLVSYVANITDEDFAGLAGVPLAAYLHDPQRSPVTHWTIKQEQSGILDCHL